MYCQSCGNKLNEGEKFCTKCGNSVDAEVVQNNNVSTNVGKKKIKWRIPITLFLCSMVNYLLISILNIVIRVNEIQVPSLLPLAFFVSTILSIAGIISLIVVVAAGNS